jgi:hypothetical protein
LQFDKRRAETAKEWEKSRRIASGLALEYLINQLSKEPPGRRRRERMSLHGATISSVSGV